MKKRLKEAVEAVLESETVDQSVLGELGEAYAEYEGAKTATMHRVEFLEDRLEEGMTKRDAAKALCEHDPRIGRRTAETLVYSNFSGMYQTSRRGRKPKADISSPPENVIPVKDDPPPVSDDEALL